MAKKKTTNTKSSPFDAPQSRNEAILQNILGASNPLGEPQSRIEALLMMILDQGGGGGGSGEKEVYTVEYGETGFSSISTAYSAGKILYCVKDDIAYYGYQAMLGANTVYCFVGHDNTNPSRISFFAVSELGGSVSYGNVTTLVMQTTTNKVTEIDADSTDTQYPSAKCVYDALFVNGMSVSAKEALIELFDHVAYIDSSAQAYIDALDAALFNVDSISAVFTQGSATIYDTDDLDDLKQYLTVTVSYTDETTAAVSDYTLSGTLTVGTSTITATYKGKTDTFSVTVTASALYTRTENDFMREVGLNNAPPYYVTNTQRISYVDFDLLLEGGKSYQFTATSTYNTAMMGVQAFNQIVLDAVNSQSSYDTTANRYNTGFIALDSVVAIPAEVNNSPIKFVRLTFRQADDSPEISNDFAIKSLTIKEVASNS